MSYFEYLFAGKVFDEVEVGFSTGGDTQEKIGLSFSKASGLMCQKYMILLLDTHHELSLSDKGNANILIWVRY